MRSSKLARARRYKALPREFCLAVTPTRVIALATSALADGNGEISGDVVVKVKREPVGTWRRGEVRAEPDGRRLRTGYSGGTLELGDEGNPCDLGRRPTKTRRSSIALLGR